MKIIEEKTLFLYLFSVIISISIWILLSSLLFSSSHKKKIKSIPLASNSIPILGNALEYKKSPDEFLVKQSQLYNGLFRINLAGMETIIISSDYVMKQFDQTSENILSSRSAVSDIGFAYTLGKLNVFIGTDLHKKIIKENFTSTNQMIQSTKSFATKLRSVMEKEFNKLLLKDSSNNNNNNNNNNENTSAIIPDFLHYIRRIILTVIVEEFISPKIHEYYDKIIKNNKNNKNDFITEFMLLQDDIETATATAAVLPLWLSLPVCLWKCEQKRKSLTSLLSLTLQNIDKDVQNGILSSDDSFGIWYNGMKSNNQSIDDIAELCIGLLFAAHKNPAIAAAQSILFLIESSSSSSSTISYLDRAYQEIDSNINNSSLFDQSLDNFSFITNVVLETLRLTAHSIGAMRKVVSEEGWKIEQLKDDGNKIEHIIPYGSYVGVTHIVPHRDPEKWGNDSNKFNPDRLQLLEKSKDIRLFTTFSSGVHICPGRHIAIMLVRLVVIVFLQNYELRKPSVLHKISKVSFERATLAQREEKCQIFIKKRSNN